jgi:hypothetical protein
MKYSIWFLRIIALHIYLEYLYETPVPVSADCLIKGIVMQSEKEGNESIITSTAVCMADITESL